MYVYVYGEEDCFTDLYINPSPLPVNMGEPVGAGGFIVQPIVCENRWQIVFVAARDSLPAWLQLGLVHENEGMLTCQAEPIGALSPVRFVHTHLSNWFIKTR